MRSLLMSVPAVLILAACQPAAEGAEPAAGESTAEATTPAAAQEAAVQAAVEAATATPQACLADGERIEGRLSSGAAMHPNGEQMHSPFLILDAPRCVGDGSVSGTRIQLIPAEGEDFDALATDSRIAITAQNYFAPETAWHFGEIIALAARNQPEPET